MGEVAEPWQCPMCQAASVAGRGACAAHAVIDSVSAGRHRPTVSLSMDWRRGNGALVYDHNPDHPAQVLKVSGTDRALSLHTERFGYTFVPKSPALLHEAMAALAALLFSPLRCLRWQLAEEVGELFSPFTERRRQMARKAGELFSPFSESSADRKRRIEAVARGREVVASLRPGDKFDSYGRLLRGGETRTEPLWNGIATDRWGWRRIHRLLRYFTTKVSATSQVTGFCARDGDSWVEIPPLPYVEAWKQIREVCIQKWDTTDVPMIYEIVQ